MKPGLLFCLLGSLLLGSSEAVSRQYRVLVHIASAQHTEHLDLTCHNNFDTSTPFVEFSEIVSQETLSNNGKDRVKLVVSQKNYQHRVTDDPSGRNISPGGGSTTSKGPARPVTTAKPVFTTTTRRLPVKPLLTTTKSPMKPLLTTTKSPMKPLFTTTKSPMKPLITTKIPTNPLITTKIPVTTIKTPVKPVSTKVPAKATTPASKKPVVTPTKKPVRPVVTTTKNSIITTKVPTKPLLTTTKGPVITTKIPAKPAATTKIPAKPVTSMPTISPVPLKPKAITPFPPRPNKGTNKPGRATKSPLSPITMKPQIVTQKPATLAPEKIAVNRFTMSVDVAGLRDLREQAMNEDDY